MSHNEKWVKNSFLNLDANMALKNVNNSGVRMMRGQD